MTTTLRRKNAKRSIMIFREYRKVPVLMEPKNCKIISMVSKPTFNPNYIKENWES